MLALECHAAELSVRAAREQSSLVVKRSLPAENERKGCRRGTALRHHDEEAFPIGGNVPVRRDAGSLEQRRQRADLQYGLIAHRNRGDSAFKRDEEELFAIASPSGRRTARLGHNDGNMINAKPFKASSVSRPSELVVLSDTSGSNDPNNTPAAAWLDSFWAGSSGPTLPVTGSENARLQTANAKHNSRVNVVYVDSHAAPSRPSALTWGQFYGVFAPGVTLKTSPSTPVPTVQSDASISTPAYDSQQWSANP